MNRSTAAEGYTVGALLHYAHDHLACAELLFERSFECFDSAAQLAHLGIELTLKAFLLHHTGSFPHDHDLRRLLDKLKAVDPKFALDVAQEKTLELVGRFDLLRYPNPAKPVAVGDPQWEAIRELDRALFLQMPTAMKDAIEARDRTKKGGRVLMSRARDSR